MAPRILSVFDEPNATLSFCNDLRAKLSSGLPMLAIDLGAVERVSTDAILLVRAIVLEGATSVRGNLPRAPLVAAKFKASGFFSGFTRPPEDLPKAEGLMHSGYDRQVVNTLAAGMVEFARKNVSISHEQASASYQTLMEVMSNTYHHARGRDRDDAGTTARWFAMVYCKDGVAHFTAADLGVGILRSSSTLHYLKLLGTRLALHGSTQVLVDAFTGKMGSSTKEPGRGEGLPRMLEDAKTHLPSMKVLTSSTVGEVATLTFRRIDVGFRGTIFRWSVGAEATES